jgi:PAP2 superfamily
LAYFKWSWLKLLGLACYGGLPFPIALAYSHQLKRKGEKALPIFLALFYCGSLGAMLYNVFPAIGPRQLFPGDFPLHPHAIAEAMRMHLEAITMKGPRNAMPSLHMAWVLLAWWYSRGTPGWVRAVTLTFLVFTVMATIGTGEHFLIDLIVAFPFALSVRALFSLDLNWKNEKRVAAFAIGMFGTFAWFWLLRFEANIFWISPLIPWMLAVITIVGVYAQEWRLHRAEAAGDKFLLQEDAPKRVGALSLEESSY